MDRYQHSGAMGLLGVPLMIVFGGLATALTAVPYAYVNAWCPIIFVNFLATGAFAAAIGYLVGLGAKLGKVRSTFFPALFGLLFGLLALYLAWAADNMGRMKLGEGSLLWNEPEALWQYVQYFYEHGFWSLRSGPNVSGIFLGIVWAVEALAIVGIPAFLAPQIIDLPFCERCDAWTNKEEGVARVLALPEHAAALSRICESGDISAFDELIRAQGDEWDLLSLTLHTCAGCTESQFLTLQRVVKSLNDKGQPQTSATDLLQYLRIPPKARESLRSAGRDATEEERARLRPEENPAIAPDPNEGAADPPAA